MLEIDLSIPLNQVRALIGDYDGSLISDDNINYLLTKHNDDVTKASLEALDYILTQVAYYVREEAGDVEVYWDDIYNQLHKRKTSLEKDTVYARSGSLFKFGGTTRSETKRVKRDAESRGIGISSEDFSTRLVSYGIDPDNPYLLEVE